MTEYLSMADRVYDDTLPPEHLHNRIATMQAHRKDLVLEYQAIVDRFGSVAFYCAFVRSREKEFARAWLARAAERSFREFITEMP